MTATPATPAEPTVVGPSLAADLAVFLRRGRLEAGMTQQQVADAAGCSDASVSSYENGTRSPSIAVLLRLVEATGRQLRWESEPLWARVDAAIDAVAAEPVANRLLVRTAGAVSLAYLLDALAAVELRVTGDVAARAYGAPSPMLTLDLLVLADEDNLHRLKISLRRIQGLELLERGEQVWVDELEVDDRELHRFSTCWGAVTVRVQAGLPPAHVLDVDGRALPLVPWEQVEAQDTWTGRLLARMRSRPASRADGAG